MPHPCYFCTMVNQIHTCRKPAPSASIACPSSPTAALARKIYSWYCNEEAEKNAWEQGYLRHYFMFNLNLDLKCMQLLHNYIML